jgi:DNA-binding winged helix-turn-helix (wHTH) protein/tetratricopeptide (TPR) repeat protein
MPYAFGPFTADRASYRVFRGRRELALTPKLLDLLFHFLDRPGTLVTKEELLDQVWPGANVTENALAQAVSELREALGDDAGAPSYIRTVARRGYRFIAAVTVTGAADDRGATAAATAARHSPAHGAGHQRTLAVLDFTNVTGDAEVAWLSAGISETVTTDFTALDHFKVVDRWRVVQAARAAGATLHDVAASVGADLVVAGSFQRNGGRLRITARVVDVKNGEALADAKVDGRLDDVFALQDDIVSSFARALGVPGASAPGRVGSVRETSSLDAFRAYTEGWLKIESLDAGQVGAAVRDFERAIEADPGYAMAYAGLANAEFIAYETTRVAPDPNYTALRSGIGHARQAVRLEPELAEAHGTLSFLLVSDMSFDEARAAARQAVALEPQNWRHRYRLGHATWGADRLHALERTLALYPQLAYAHLEIAMMFVARGELDTADRHARAGVVEQDRQARSGNRFPAIGCHWLLGALEARAGRHAEAIRAFDREIEQADPNRLYGAEYAAVALTARGHSEFALDRFEDACGSFRLAERHVDRFARASMGAAAALERLGRTREAEDAWQAVERGRERLEHTGRTPEALLVGACAAAMRADTAAVTRRLERFLANVPPSHLGWTIPIEPCFSGLERDPGFRGILDELAKRAV